MIRLSLPRAFYFCILASISVCLGSLAATAKDVYRLKENIPYYDAKVRETDAYIKERCVLDFYFPESVKAYPTIVWFHGGGLKNGNKSIPERLKENGIGIIAVNYRLYPKAKCPAYLEDTAASVAWAFHNVKDYGGDPDKIFVAGSSAGGYLTAMVGLDKRWLAAFGVDADDIAGLMPLAGQMFTHFTVREERGLGRMDIVVDDLAPISHLRKEAPPILFATGDRELEMLGRYEENAIMWRMLKLAGHPDVRLLEFDGYGHAPGEPFFPLMLKE
ncbi:MAG: alpha/beta hydrolase, partial [Verrucomicrobiae bacterium]|nr:alpha/beta hydrolase [Verrucomicrobiae bacterium]